MERSQQIWRLLPGFAGSALNKLPQRCASTVATPAKRRSVPKWRAAARRSKAPQLLSEQATFRLAPSDFAFLWDECKRCFYLKAHKKLYRPRAPFPSIFGTIDLGMKRHFRGLTTTALLPDMKQGVFLCEDDDAWVECRPITPPGHSDSVYIRGMVRRIHLHFISVLNRDVGALQTLTFRL